MKKILIILPVLLILIGAGCNDILATNKSGVVKIKVKNNNYSINEANGYTSIDFEIINGTRNKIYFGDFQCNTPIKIYRLTQNNDWVFQSNLLSICMGLSAGKPTPRILKSGKTFDTENLGNEIKETVIKAGIYKLEFRYYLNEDDFDNRENIQSVFSNQFEVKTEITNLTTVIESCKKADSRTSRLVECLYVSAKNSAIKNLELSIDLCEEIKNLNHGFDGCYDGVALILKQKGQVEKAKNICNNYKEANRTKQCVEM